MTSPETFEPKRDVDIGVSSSDATAWDHVRAETYCLASLIIMTAGWGSIAVGSAVHPASKTSLSLSLGTAACTWGVASAMKTVAIIRTLKNLRVPKP